MKIVWAFLRIFAVGKPLEKPTTAASNRILMCQCDEAMPRKQSVPQTHTHTHLRVFMCVCAAAAISAHFTSATTANEKKKQLQRQQQHSRCSLLAHN